MFVQKVFSLDGRVSYPGVLHKQSQRVLKDNDRLNTGKKLFKKCEKTIGDQSE